MAKASQDVTVRFLADTGNIAKGSADVQGHLRGVATSLQGIAQLGAVVGAVSFFTNAIGEAQEAARVTRQTEAVIKSTGGAAKVTAQQIGDLSESLSELAGVDDEVIQHGANVLLTFTKVKNEVGQGNDVFNQATELALDMSAALSEAGDSGEGLQSSITRIGKALNDPLKGMTALQKVGVTFSEQQKQQVKQFVEQGDILSAQKLILAELRTEFGGMAAASADEMTKAKVALGNFAEEVGMKVLPAVEAVSGWAVNTGIPALQKTADVVGDVVTPVFSTLAAAGKGAIDTFSGLPGPIQAGAVALGAWMLVGDKVTGMFERMRAPVKGFGDDVRTVMTASGGEVGRFGASIQVLQDRVPTIGAMGAAFRKAQADGEGFASTLRGSLSAAAVGAKGAMQGLVGFLGGPWGVTLAAGTALIGAFVAKNQEATRRQNELRDAGKQVAQVIKEQNGALNQATRVAAANAAEGKGLLKMAEDIGISGREVVDAIEQQGAAYDNLIRKVQDKVKADIDNKGAMEAAAGSAGKLHNSLVTLIGGQDEQFAAMNRVNQASQQSTEQQQALAGAQNANKTSSDLLKEAVEGLGGEFDETKTSGQQLVDVIKGLTNAQTDAIEAEENYEGALDSLTESIKTNGATLDIHTEKGRNNRDALENAATAIRDMTLADIQSGVPAAEAIRRHDARAAALQAEATKLGLTKDQTQLLINKYAEIPPQVRTIASLIGAESAIAQLNSLSLAARAVKENISIRVAAGLYRNDPDARRASGGLIYGPGGPRSDLVPLWASNGEYVQQASAVDYYGVATMNALNQRRIPKDALMGRRMARPMGYRDGGWLDSSSMAFASTATTFAANRSGALSVNLTVNGPIGSQRELENWLTQSLDNLRRKGRLT